jgi:hypothetical protein
MGLDLKPHRRRLLLTDGSFTNQDMNDAICILLFKRAENRWRSYSASGLLTKISRLLFGSGHPPAAIYLTEHSDADWHSMHCDGAIVRAWKQDQDGLTEVPFTDVDSGELCGHYWQKQLMRFHISPDGQRVLWNDIEGPRRGQLIVFGVRGFPTEPKLRVEQTSLSI